MPLNPLEALQTLMGGPGVSNAASNPAVELAGLRDDRLGEMKRNLAKRGGGFSTGATPFDAADLENDIANDPTTGAVEQNRVAGINRANTAAQLGGFRGAPEAAAAERATKLAESRIPIDVANVSGQTQRGVANIQGQNAAEIERMKETQATSRAHDALKQMLGVPMGEGDTITLPGGGAIKHGSVPFPTGPAGVGLEKAIKSRMEMENPSGLGNFLGLGPGDADKAAAERALDAQFPQWRQRMDPGFKFAIPGGGVHQPQAAPAGAAPAAVPQAAAPGGRMERPLRSGGVAYSDDGGKTWYTEG